MGKYWPKNILHFALQPFFHRSFVVYDFYSNSDSSRSSFKSSDHKQYSHGAEFNRQHKKVATTLVALTTAFVICWSPFMVTRTLLYYHPASYDLIWTGSQLLVCLNAAVGSFVIRVLRRKPQKFITKTPAVQLLTTATS